MQRFNPYSSERFSQFYSGYPYSILILSDLTDGKQADRWITVDLDNFNAVMRSLKVGCRVVVGDKKRSLTFDLKFESLASFGASNIINSNSVTRKLLVLRNVLARSTHEFRVARFSEKQFPAFLSEIWQEVMDKPGVDLTVVTKGETLNQLIRTGLENNLVDYLELAKFMLAFIDRYLSEKIDAVRSDPRFLDLEQRWSVIFELLYSCDADKGVRLQVKSISQDDFLADIEESPGDSMLSRSLKAEFATAGGTPVNAVMADFAFNISSEQHVNHLKSIGEICNANHAVFITNAAAEGFDVDSIAELEHVHDLQSYFESQKYIPWKNFREQTISRNVVLCASVLTVSRRIHETMVGTFEYTAGDSSIEIIQIRPAIGLAMVICREFLSSGWILNIDGVDGGLITIKDRSLFRSSNPNSSEQISSRVARQLTKCGFVAFVYHHELSQFFIWDAICTHRVNIYSATHQVYLSRSLNVCQFAIAANLLIHFLDRIDLDKQKTELENWLGQFVANGSEEYSFEKPLASAIIERSEDSMNAGFNVTIKPAFQMSEICEVTFCVKICG